MSTFNIGDRVRAKENLPYRSRQAGATAIVTEVNDERSLITVVWDKGPLRGSQMDGGYDQQEFEVIREAGRFIIIIEDKLGKLAPALSPREYTSKEQAFRVAEEMAKTHEGSTFIVFKAVASTKTEIVKSVAVKLQEL
jgi:hypothetical protein